MLALAPPLTHTHSTPSASRTSRPLPRKQASSSAFLTSASSASASLTLTTHAVPPSLGRPASATYQQSRHASTGSLPAALPPPAASAPIPGPSQPKSRPEVAPVPLPQQVPTVTPVPADVPRLDIHTYNPQELLRQLASLLTQIATTNDALPPAAPSSAPCPPPPSDPRASLWRTFTGASRTSLASPSTVLAFHARNVPTISLEAYLLRILKYCPTTNEVFLSLLVYFDRMSKLVGDATGRTFVIDSYNVHRLVIAGVTVASKFFSDVFYTNSRYAKVGGLPQAELNQLELQFLLLNDFRLTIHPEEMQRYAEQLVAFAQPASTATTAPPAPAPVPAPVSVPAPQHAPSTYTDYAGGPRAMGAIDAYGGRLPSDDAYERTREHGTPRRPQSPRRGVSEASSSAADGESECGASEDGGETDDEPTIRAAESVCGSEASVWTDEGRMGSP